MASVFKRGGRKNRDGRYLGCFRDENGDRVTRCTGTTDKDSALKIAERWEDDAALRRAGLIDRAAERHAEENRRPLADHVREYIEHCRHVGQDKMHVWNKEYQLNRIMEKMKAERLSDLEPNRVEAYLRSLIAEGKSYRTHNHNRTTILAFYQWCVESGKAASNILKIVPALNDAKDRRRVRRAMSDAELGALLAVPEVIESGRDLYYLFAALSGIRVKAVKAATWGDVDLDGGSIRVKVGNAKGKREDAYFPLHPQLAARLREIKSPFFRATDRVFRSVPTVVTFHRDCTRAKIARYDAEGRQLDRHALRTTCGTRLAKSGVSPQLAMKAMGHTDMRVTLKHYTDLRIHDVAQAVAMVPDVEAIPLAAAIQVEALATGTDNQTLAISAQRQAQRTGGETCLPMATHGDTLPPTANPITTPCHPAQVSYNATIGDDGRHGATHGDKIERNANNDKDLRAISSVGYDTNSKSPGKIKLFCIPPNQRAAHLTARSAAQRRQLIDAILSRLPDLDNESLAELLDAIIEASQTPRPTDADAPGATEGHREGQGHPRSAGGVPGVSGSEI